MFAKGFFQAMLSLSMVRSFIRSVYIYIGQIIAIHVIAGNNLISTGSFPVPSSTCIYHLCGEEQNKSIVSVS